MNKKCTSISVCKLTGEEISKWFIIDQWRENANPKGFGFGLIRMVISK